MERCCLTCVYCDETLFNRRFCDNCKDLSKYKHNEDIKLCPKCDKRVPVENEVCNNCGYEFKKED